MPKRVIAAFDGPYEFLSNFHHSPWIYLDGDRYPTVEHAYQAAKTKSPIVRARIRGANTPGIAKRLGQRGRLQLRADWELVKRELMLQLLRQKFVEPKIRKRLLATGKAKLVEGNHWHDNIWGNCDCGAPSCAAKGKNWLGKALMQVREELSGEDTT
jgi:ribA/ribD-fused uncharacterized protein